MNQNHKIAKNSLILYFRLIITTIIGLIVTRLVIRYLGVSDYGLYSVVGSIVVLMNFLNTVMISTTYRYIAYELGKEGGKDVNKVFNISLSIHVALLLLVIILAETVGIWYIHKHLNIEPNKVNDAIFVFRCSILATIINIFSIPFQGFITAMEKFGVRASIEILRSVLNLLFVVLLGYIFGNKLRYYAVLMTIVTVLPSSLFIIYCKTKYHKYTRWNLQRDKVKYKEMIGYSGWIMIGAAAQVGKQTGTPVLINYFFGTILNAAFGIANQLNRFLMMFVQSLGEAAIPQIIKSFSGGDHTRTLNLVAYISKYSFFLLLLPGLPILLETNFLIRLWIGEIPEYTITFCKLMIVNILLETLNSGIPAAIQATGKIKWFQIINSTILLLGLPTTFLLFRFGFSPYYSVIVYIIISILNIFINLLLLKRIINFNVKYLLKTSYFRAGLVFLFILPLFFIVPIFPEGILRFAITSFVSFFYYIVIIYILGFDKKERKLIYEVICSLRQRVWNHSK